MKPMCEAGCGKRTQVFGCKYCPDCYMQKSLEEHEQRVEQRIELKNCPFCGGKPNFPESKDVFGTFYEAGCQDCSHAQISIQIIDCFDRPRGHVHESWDEEVFQYGIEFINVARRKAMGEWNTRVPGVADAGLQEKVDPLQKALVDQTARMPAFGEVWADAHETYWCDGEGVLHGIYTGLPAQPHVDGCEYYCQSLNTYFAREFIGKWKRDTSKAGTVMGVLQEAAQREGGGNA